MPKRQSTKHMFMSGLKLGTLHKLDIKQAFLGNKDKACIKGRRHFGVQVEWLVHTEARLVHTVLGKAEFYGLFEKG